MPLEYGPKCFLCGRLTFRCRVGSAAWARPSGESGGGEPALSELLSLDEYLKSRGEASAEGGLEGVYIGALGDIAFDEEDAEDAVQGRREAAILEPNAGSYLSGTPTEGSPSPRMEGSMIVEGQICTEMAAGKGRRMHGSIGRAICGRTWQLRPPN